jgi:hypothetical protein
MNGQNDRLDDANHTLLFPNKGIDGFDDTANVTQLPTVWDATRRGQNFRGRPTPLCTKLYLTCETWSQASTVR